MKCPLCKSREHIQIGLHADGFAQDIRECGDCGGIWTFSGHLLKVIKEGDQAMPMALSEMVCSNFVCPTCKSLLCVETDLDSFQFHEKLHECTNCGTICSMAHDKAEVVRDSQSGSFLSTTPELVESDDYIFI